MASVPTTNRMSVLDYLELEQIPDQPKHEYIDGEVFEIENASPIHGELVVRIGGLLDLALRGRCHVYIGPRVYATPNKCLYPDITVLCCREQLHGIRIEDET